LPFTSLPITAKSQLEGSHWIGFENEINRGHANRGFELGARLEAFESVLPDRVFVLDRLVGESEASLKSMNGGVVSASSAGQRGWSMMGTLVICSVAVFSSELSVDRRHRPLEVLSSRDLRSCGGRVWSDQGMTEAL
jgi:hypothetical protein